MQIDLANKIALITGASGELGRVMASTLAGCGASVAIHYLKNHAMAHRLCEELTARGVRATAFQADITSADEVFAMKAEVNKSLGPPDIIVNNAVIQYAWTTVLEQSLVDYESQFRSCVVQNVLMAKAFIPAMIEKRWGRIIAISTECAMQNTPTQSAYVSGKRGMDGVLRCLAREIGQHQITVNQVAPGWTISEKDRANGAERRESYENMMPLRRRGTDQEIANVVAFLASDLASYIPVCGGNVMPAI
jgi:3-oxoacyl-[acyl-carrier protein] reductase